MKAKHDTKIDCGDTKSVRFNDFSFFVKMWLEFFFYYDLYRTLNLFVTSWAIDFFIADSMKASLWLYSR